jgi:hypothetical protein
MTCSLAGDLTGEPSFVSYTISFELVNSGFVFFAGDFSISLVKGPLFVEPIEDERDWFSS